MSWTYKQHEIGDITQFPENTFGFVYMTTHKPSGKSYIGKKVLFHNQKKKLGKKELAEQPITRGRTSTTKQIIKESDWKTYYGSAKPTLGLLKENKHEEFKREIIKITTSKKLLTYYETKILFTLGVLENPEYYFNDNVLGKFFAKDFL